MGFVGGRTSFKRLKAQLVGPSSFTISSYHQHPSFVGLFGFFFSQQDDESGGEVVSECPPNEELNNAKQNMERYGYEADKLDLKSVKKRIAAYSATVLEARLLLAYEDPDIPLAHKKKKLEQLVAKIGEDATFYEVDMKLLVLPRLISEGVNKVMRQ